MSRTWSPQQNTIFGWYEDTTRKYAVIEAGAGCAKTSTTLEGVNRAPEKRILLMSFNKRIADELQAKVTNEHAEVKTSHGLGFQFVRRNWENVRVDSGRGKRLAAMVCGAGAPDAMVALVTKLADLGKQMAPMTENIYVLRDIAYEMDVIPDPEWEEEGWTVERVAELALQAMLKALVRDGTVDFTDMIYLPIRMNWVRPIYDLVCIDEVQDLNVAQIELATRCISKNGRAVAVGDKNQAIYRFRGADSGSIDRLKKAWVGAETFPLSITYRCGKAIVEEANRIVPEFFAAPSAPEGVVRSIGASKLPSEVKAGDFVISRKNAPLVRVCLSILRTGTRAKVEGRDIGRNLLALIRKLKAKSMPDFLKRLTAWGEREIKRLANLKPEIAERKSAEIEDTAETLRVLADGLSGLPELEARIERLFADDVAAGRSGMVVCSTIHRVKGLEADRAFILKGTLATGKRAGNREEMNCEYVAITRAKNELIWVEGEV
jgi:DNA helicase-2/ATP-dependent DNA helicase PcrA